MGDVRQRLHLQLDPEAGHPRVISPLNRVVLAAVVAAVLIAILSTERSFLPDHRDLLLRVDRGILLFFAVELAGRFWVAGLNPRHAGISGLLRFTLRPSTLTDMVVLVPLFIDLEGSWLTLFRMVRVLRLFQVTEIPAAARAIRAFRSALKSHWFELGFTGVLGAGLLLASSVALYLIEGRLQPDIFGSVPRSIWWSVVTFTTVGYGDAVPITPLGRVIAGFHAIAGLAVVAMFTGIIASALTESVEERDKQDTGPPSP
ncbi:MAG: potassium channel family protein [Pseudomonadota bacterium]